MGRATEDAVFTYLNTHEAAVPSDIAASLGLSTSAVKRALRKLRGRGARPLDGHIPGADKRWTVERAA